MSESPIKNPYRPGAGHQPPCLAGREKEIIEFNKLLDQDIILENVVLTGLRGVGKTVLLDEFKPLAIKKGWSWVGTDLSESVSVDEARTSLRMLTDLSVASSHLEFSRRIRQAIGFAQDIEIEIEKLTFDVILEIYRATPGLPSDKLKNVLEVVWSTMKENDDRHGIIFAYDECQNLSDHAKKSEYPLSLILDVFQSIQKKNIPFMLVLTGLPTLQTKLVEARTFAERMFHVMFLLHLDQDATERAIREPLKKFKSAIRFSEDSIPLIAKVSGGYPYFIQFICREAFDCFLKDDPEVPINEIIRKLDNDFFAGRWGKATDRQRDLLIVISNLNSCDDEFTVQAVVEQSKDMPSKQFSSSHVNQMLNALSKSGLIYKNRHGKYSLAVPMLADFIKRQSTVTGQRLLFD